ncbi:MAG: hypothetical protein KJ060_18335 [Candidatus Hydrogenedentes bacterium]|nr:hypothetical protein [Candidatus Hydrogenedentota bacterium]
MKLHTDSFRIAVTITAVLLLAVCLMPGCGFGGPDESAVPVSELPSELEEAAQGVGTPDDPAVFVKSGQSAYHTNGCKWLSRGRPGVDAMTKSQAEAQGYTPCEECISQEN